MSDLPLWKDIYAGGNYRGRQEKWQTVLCTLYGLHLRFAICFEIYKQKPPDIFRLRRTDCCVYRSFNSGQYCYFCGENSGHCCHITLNSIRIQLCSHCRKTVITQLRELLNEMEKHRRLIRRCFWLCNKCWSVILRHLFLLKYCGRIISARFSFAVILFDIFQPANWTYTYTLHLPA